MVRGASIERVGSPREESVRIVDTWGDQVRHGHPSGADGGGPHVGAHSPFKGSGQPLSITVNLGNGDK